MSELLELRLALLAATVALGTGEAGKAGCAAAMDEATRFASRASKAVMRSISVPAEMAVRVRFGAMRSINSTCAACGACPRGRNGGRVAGVMPGLDQPKTA